MSTVIKIILRILLLLYIVIAAAIFVIYFLSSHHHHRDRVKAHSILMMAGTISFGLALIMFRLLQGGTTRAIKYLHFLCHTIAMVLFIVGWIIVDHNKPLCLHNGLAYHFMAYFLVQYVLGFFIFVYLYPSETMRIYFAPFHGILGMWLYLCCIMVYLTGFHFKAEIRYIVSSALAKQQRQVTSPWGTNVIAVLSYCLFLIVLGTLLCPQFEWELVGPL